MIFKYEIVEAVNSLGMDLAVLASRVSHLEELYAELEKKCKKKECAKKCTKGCCPKEEKKTKTTAKRGPGRPRKV